MGLRKEFGAGMDSEAVRGPKPRSRRLIKPTLLLLFLLPAFAGQHLMAPLPDKILHARTVYLVNQTGDLNLFDDLFTEAMSMPQWGVTTKREAADMFLVLHVGTYYAGSLGWSSSQSNTTATAMGSGRPATAHAQTDTQGSSLSIPIYKAICSLTFAEPNGAEILTLNHKCSGWGRGVHELMRDIEKRLH